MNASRSILPRALVPALLLSLAVPALAARLPNGVLGLRPGMTDHEVRERLEKIGRAVRGEDMAKQTWKLRDARYEYLVLRYDADWKLQWATLFARANGRRVRYRDIGDLSLASHTGQHFFTWTVPAGGGPGDWTVVARGGDPTYLESISVLTGPGRQALIVPGHGEPHPERDDD